MFRALGKIVSERIKRINHLFRHSDGSDHSAQPDLRERRRALILSPESTHGTHWRWDLDSAWWQGGDRQDWKKI